VQKLFIPCLLTLSLSLLVPIRNAHAADASFDISGSSSTRQTLGGNETGVVELNSTLATTTDNVVITVDNSKNTGQPISITNYGTINDTYSTDDDQSSRDIRITGAGTNLTITNASTGTIETSNADVIQEGKGITDSNVTINNSGVINSKNTNSDMQADYGAGQQAIDLGNDTTGTIKINNYTSGTIEAYDSDAIQSGANAVIHNDGTIESTEPALDVQGNDGIDTQANSGVTIVNGNAIAGDTSGTASIIGARHGITGGNTDTTTNGTFTMSITNNGGDLIEGNNGSGVNIDGFNGNEVVTIVNAGTISGNATKVNTLQKPTPATTADGDGVDVDGLVNLTNSGTIESLNAIGDASEGVTVGGGSIINEKGGVIIGELASGNTSTGASGVGITLAGLDKDPVTDATISPPENIFGNTTVDNSGQIIGADGAGIQATGFQQTTDTPYTIKITNEAGGLIEGSGAGAAIQLSNNDDTIIEDGTIKADTSGVAVDLGAGHNEFDVENSAASVTGSISGGTGSTNSLMTVQVGNGNTFKYSGAISNFASVDIQNGAFNLNGSVSGGTTTIESGAMLSGNNTVGALDIAGTLSPGNSPGLTMATSAKLEAAGNFLLQVDNDGSMGAAGTNWDQLAVTGTVDISALGSSSGNQFTFDLQSLNSSDAAGALASFNHDVSHVWTDVITSSGLAGSFSSSDFNVNTSLFNEKLDGTFSIQQDASNSNDLDLVYTAAPEPSTWALLFGGAGLLAAFARFRNRFI
jgi:hypothetical protein